LFLDTYIVDSSFDLFFFFHFRFLFACLFVWGVDGWLDIRDKWKSRDV